MELRTYFRIAARRWWLVAAPVLVVAAYVGATFRAPITTYQVAIRFAAGTSPSGLSQDYDRYYPWLTSEYVANGLADVAVTGAFADAVSARLSDSGFRIPGAAIQAATVADNAQSILVVYVTWPDPGQAVTIAEAITAELTQNAASYYPQLKGVEPAVRPLDQAQPVPNPPGLRAELAEPVIRIGLAFVVGLGLAFLWHYLDPTVQEASQLESLGLEVVAVLPKRRNP